MKKQLNGETCLLHLIFLSEIQKAKHKSADKSLNKRFELYFSQYFLIE